MSKGRERTGYVQAKKAYLAKYYKHFQTLTSNGVIYRGRISFAGGNCRRSAAISGGKQNASPVEDDRNCGHRHK